MAVVDQLITAEDLLRIPDDGFRYELVRGELRNQLSGCRYADGRGDQSAQADGHGLSVAGQDRFAARS